MSKKSREEKIQFLNNFKHNIQKKHEEMYKINIITSSPKGSYYYDGFNPLLKYGAGFPVRTNGMFGLKLVNCLAYKKDGELYEMFTNRHVKLVELGYNKIEDGELLAAEYIEAATLGDANKLLEYMMNKYNNVPIELRHKRRNKMLIIRKKNEFDESSQDDN